MRHAIVRLVAAVCFLSVMLGAAGSGGPIDARAGQQSPAYRGADRDASSRALPARNGLIAFEREDPDTFDSSIAVVDPASGVVTTLTQDNFDKSPAWSPDGTRIVFARNGGSCIVIDAEGTKLAEWPVHCYDASWGPGGDFIVFSNNDGISRLETQSGQVTNVLPFNVAYAPSLSPDGTKIAYVKASAPMEPFEIWLMDLNGSNQMFLVSDAYDPEWSPDGSHLLFSRTVLGLADEIWRVNVDGSEQIRLTSARDYGPAYAPDGTAFAFSTTSGEEAWLTIADADGSNRRTLTNGSFDWRPDWQPVPSIIHSVEFTQGIQEWQTLDELTDDLEGDGQPPVPIIAGKPAVLRIYFEQLEDPIARYHVHLSGAFQVTVAVVLNNTCSPEDRRKQISGCNSVDYYFAPPEGDWSVTIEIRGDDGAVVQTEDFHLTSVTADTVVLRAVRMCHALGNVANVCGDPATLAAHMGFMRSILPARDVQLQLTGHTHIDEIGPNPTEGDWQSWWSRAVAFVDSLFWSTGGGISLGEQHFYVGAVNPSAGGYGGLASSIPGRGYSLRTDLSRFGNDATKHTFAHENGHVLGGRHTAVLPPVPACYGLSSDPQSDWIHPDNFLRSDSGAIEVGFDVPWSAALPGDENYELMGYCYPKWISPHTYNKLLANLASLVQPNTQNLRSLAGPSWLVRATVDGSATFEPLYSVPTGAPDGPGSGDYRIEVRDGAESILYERALDIGEIHTDILEGGTEPDPVLSFSHLVPALQDAAAIVVLDDQDQELGRITFGGQAPVVSIDQVVLDAGSATVDWSITDDDGQLWAWVEYSPDGVQWQSLGRDLAATTLTADLGWLAGSAAGHFRVTVSDGANTGVATSDPVEVPGHLPEVTITGPGRDFFRAGQVVALDALAYDADDGMLTGASVQWFSDLDGALGQGAHLLLYDLSPGTHTVTVTVTDADDNQASDQVTATVSDYPVIEGLHRWGDHDCSGEVDGGDVLAALAALVGAGDSEFCYASGTVVPTGGTHNAWGDLDCDGAVDLADILALRRDIAGLPVSQEAGCPPVREVIS